MDFVLFLVVGFFHEKKRGWPAAMSNTGRMQLFLMKIVNILSVYGLGIGHSSLLFRRDEHIVKYCEIMLDNGSSNRVKRHHSEHTRELFQHVMHRTRLPRTILISK